MQIWSYTPCYKAFPSQKNKTKENKQLKTACKEFNEHVVELKDACLTRFVIVLFVLDHATFLHTFLPAFSGFHSPDIDIISARSIQQHCQTFYLFTHLFM